MTVRILVPDTQFEGDPVPELEALGERVERDRQFAKTPEESGDNGWAAADAVMLWHVMDITPRSQAN